MPQLNLEGIPLPPPTPIPVEPVPGTSSPDWDIIIK